MATKKQKRAAALAKREAFLEEERKRGLEAQRYGRIDDNLTKLIEMLEEAMGRLPSEDEDNKFINGNEKERIDMINLARIGV